MMTGLLALTLTAAFTGAAIYVSAVEQPSRLGLDDGPLLQEWKPSYHRGAIMQASLAVICFLLGLLAWWQTSLIAYLVGALLIIMAWPWTIFVMMPTNKALEAIEPAQAGAHSRQLIAKWGSMHLVRLALGAFATSAYLVACLEFRS